MHRISHWWALFLVLAMTAPLALPAPAGATVAPPVVDNDLLTVTADQGADLITLTVIGEFIAVNGVATTLKAGDAAEIEVDAGGGNDVVDASALAAANYGDLGIDGGAGDDVLTGGADADNLAAAAGDDRLIGFKGTDEVLGEEGDDVMVWNNGDGSDVDNGGAGNDESEVNGAPTAGDAFVFKPDAGIPGGVRFDRTNLVEFHIELTAERLTLNGLGGNDDIRPDPAGQSIAGLTSLTLNGGPGADGLAGDAAAASVINGGDGDDNLLGGGGADLLSGGSNSDLLVAGGGDDRVVGDRGSDRLIGGDGDDTLVWSNGDGSDVDEARAGFDRLEVNGSAVAADAFELAPDPLGGVTFRRTNLVPFSIRMVDEDDNPELLANGGFEAVAVNGGAGDDSFAAAPGLGTLQVVADGGAGADRLSGSAEPDSLFGGSGNDAIDGGAGSDVSDGQDGNDRLEARDGVGDLVRGGAGVDSARTDATTLDAVDGVESLDATAPPVRDVAALAPVVRRVSVLAAGKRLFARATVSCPAAEAGGCHTALAIETARRQVFGGLRAVLVLGSKSVTLAPGQSATVRVPLAPGLAGLSRRHPLAALVRIESRDDAGNSVTSSHRISLRLPAK